MPLLSAFHERSSLFIKKIILHLELDCIIVNWSFSCHFIICVSKIQLAWSFLFILPVGLWLRECFITSLIHNSFPLLHICFPMSSLHCSPVHPQSPCLPHQPGPSPFCWLLWLLPHHEGVKVSPAHHTTIPHPLPWTVLLIIALAFVLLYYSWLFGCKLNSFQGNLFKLHQYAILY